MVSEGFGSAGGIEEYTTALGRDEQSTNPAGHEDEVDVFASWIDILDGEKGKELVDSSLDVASSGAAASLDAQKPLLDPVKMLNKEKKSDILKLLEPSTGGAARDVQPGRDEGPSTPNSPTPASSAAVHHRELAASVLDAGRRDHAVQYSLSAGFGSEKDNDLSRLRKYKLDSEKEEAKRLQQFEEGELVVIKTQDLLYSRFLFEFQSFRSKLADAFDPEAFSAKWNAFHAQKVGKGVAGGAAGGALGYAASSFLFMGVTFFTGAVLAVPAALVGVGAAVVCNTNFPYMYKMHHKFYQFGAQNLSC